MTKKIQPEIQKRWWTRDHVMYLIERNTWTELFVQRNFQASNYRSDVNFFPGKTTLYQYFDKTYREVLFFRIHRMN